MPPKKKALTKSKGQNDTPQHTIIKTELASISGLQVYYKNPRIGDVNEIAKSLHVNGQFKPIVVNVGTHTGRNDEILAGNHTYLGARKELQWTEGDKSFEKPQWTHLWISYVDVDEDAAKRIVLADNATSDRGEYDERLRAEMLLDLPDITGTGYTMDEFEDIVAEFGITDDFDLDDSISSLDSLDDDEQERKTFVGAPLGDEDEVDDEDDSAPKSTRERIALREQGIDMTKMPEELNGVLQLDDSPYFDFVRVHGIDMPRLLEDMLVRTEDLPEKFKTWAGSATRDEEDPDMWWLYNYGVDSTSGMQDVSKTFVSFFTYDEYFERWWDTPSKYVAKLIHSKVKHILTPDFSSVSEMGNTFAMWQLYRSRYLGRYFQEAGMRLLPHPIWPDGDMDFLVDITLPSLPPLPVLCLQLQTIDPKNVTGGMEHFKDQIQTILKTVQSETILLYAGGPGKELMDELDTYGADVRWLDTRQTALSAKAKGRQKKKGL